MRAVVHELSIGQSIVEEVCDRIGDARGVRVVVEIGALAAIAPDALRFCFDLCTAGTALEGAALDIVTTSGEELRVRQVEVI